MSHVVGTLGISAFGDISENAEYKAAKQRYYENNRRS
ncbi:hypothetical protein [Clostridium acidisoli]